MRRVATPAASHAQHRGEEGIAGRQLGGFARCLLVMSPSSSGVLEVRRLAVPRTRRGVTLPWPPPSPRLGGGLFAGRARRGRLPFQEKSRIIDPRAVCVLARVGSHWGALAQRCCPGSRRVGLVAMPASEPDNYPSSPQFGRCQPLTARLRRVAWECLTQGSGNKVRGGVMPGLGIAI